MVVAETIAGLGALKTAFDMTKGLQDIHNTVARDRAVIELQKEIIAAQSAQSDLIQRVRDLEKEVAAFETWNSEKQRYALKDMSGRGEFAYLIKKSEQRGEPSHAICAGCYQQDKKSILQWSGKGYDPEVHWKCPVCDNLISTFGPIVPV